MDTEPATPDRSHRTTASRMKRRLPRPDARKLTLPAKQGEEAHIIRGYN